MNKGRVQIGPHAEGIPFDNSANGFVADRVQPAIEEAKGLAGSVAAGTFTGNPKTATVVFASALPNANYKIQLSGTDARFFIPTNILNTGFTIDTQANQALTGPVFWEVKQ